MSSYSPFLMLSLTLLLNLLLTPLAAPAASGDDENLRRLLNARSSTQFAKRLDEQRRLSHDRLVCDAELRTAKLPVACFRALAFETEREEIARHSFDWLLQLCRDRAAKSKKPSELELAEAESTLPERCRAAVRERAADLRYSEEVERPADLFGRLTRSKTRARASNQVD